MNPTLHDDGGRAVLRFERRLGHPVEKVWRAISEPGHMAHWFPSPIEAADMRLGGTITFVPNPAGLETPEAKITEVGPPHVLAFTWHDDLLRFELRPDADGCVLVFTHTFADRPMAGSYATGWETCLGALTELLAGRPPATPPAPENYAARHDAYAEAFGLGMGEVSEEGDGWTIRFERLVPHPVEKVWPALVEPAVPATGAAPPPRAVAGGGDAEAGRVTAVTAPRLLEYETPSGRVRWELVGGHPAGTRLVLTESGTARPGGGYAPLLAGRHALLDALAERLRGAGGPPPLDRVAELTRRYAGRAEAR